MLSVCMQRQSWVSQHKYSESFLRAASLAVRIQLRLLVHGVRGPRENALYYLSAVS